MIQLIFIFISLSPSPLLVYTILILIYLLNQVVVSKDLERTKRSVTNKLWTTILSR